MTKMKLWGHGYPEKIAASRGSFPIPVKIGLLSQAFKFQLKSLVMVRVEVAHATVSMITVLVQA
jgi:hypothetical protein